MEHPRKKVLIVDEDEDDLFFARRVLSDQGYEVLTHRSPFGVTGLIQAAEPDVVLLGANLRAFPAEDLAAHLRADDRTRHIPIVLYSSDDDAHARAQVVKYRLSGHITSGDAAELRMKVAYFLNEHMENPWGYRQRLYAVE
jgi:PleD family two-component response regulator